MSNLEAELNWWRAIEDYTGCRLFLRPTVGPEYLPDRRQRKYGLQLWLISPVRPELKHLIMTVHIGQHPQQIIAQNIGELLQFVEDWLEEKPDLLPEGARMLDHIGCYDGLPMKAPNPGEQAEIG